MDHYLLLAIIIPIWAVMVLGILFAWGVINPWRSTIDVVRP